MPATSFAVLSRLVPNWSVVRKRIKSVIRTTHRRMLDEKVKEILKGQQYGHILDIGGKGPDYMPAVVAEGYQCMDIVNRPGVDIVADIHHWKAPDSADLILLLEVLEHLYDPVLALKNVKSTLRPGGKLVVSAPFLYPFHADPFDYYRYTDVGLEHLLKEFDDIRVYRLGSRWTVASMLVESTRLGPLVSAVVGPFLSRLASRGPAFTGVVAECRRL